MKFTISQSELQKAIRVVYPAIKESVVVPICETIKLVISDDNFQLIATNLQVELSVLMAGKFDETGSFCLPATKLKNLIDNLADQPLSIETNNKIATIKTANGKYELPISDASDFPVFKVEPDKSIDIGAGLFQSAIKKTIFACSDDDMRPALTGVFIEIKDGKILFTSTDAHRVNHSEHTIESDLDISLIVPANSLKLLPEIIGNLQLSFSNNNLSIIAGDISFKAMLVDAPFPDYRSVIPVNEKILTVDRAALLSAIKRVSGFANFATNLLKLELGIQTILSGHNVEFSEYAEETIFGDFNADEMAIGLNSLYLHESITAMEKDQVFILFSEPKKGVLIKEEIDSADYIMVMPQILSA